MSKTKQLALVAIFGIFVGNSLGATQLTFGVYRTDKSTVMYRKFIPVLEALQADTAKQSGIEFDIDFRIFKTYDEAIESLCNGQVDFVRFGPASYILAKQRNPSVRLLAMEHKKGKKRFKGVFVVQRNSPIKKLGDLKGKRFAFGDRNSTIGRFLAQDLLLKAGIDATHLDTHKFLGRHDKVAKAVELGDFDAGSLKMGTYKKVNKTNKLRVLTTFDNVTKPWVARANLDLPTYTALKVALLNFEHPVGLRSLGVSGFQKTSDDEYTFVQEAMENSTKFGE